MTKVLAAMAQHNRQQKTLRAATPFQSLAASIPRNSAFQKTCRSGRGSDNPRPNQAVQSTHVYKVRPRQNRREVDLISEVLPFDRLWYGEPNAVANAINYAKFFSRSHDAVIRVRDEAGNVIETHEQAGEFKAW